MLSHLACYYEALVCISVLIGRSIYVSICYALINAMLVFATGSDRAVRNHGSAGGDGTEGERLHTWTFKTNALRYPALTHIDNLL